MAGGSVIEPTIFVNLLLLLIFLHNSNKKSPTVKIHFEQIEWETLGRTKLQSNIGTVFTIYVGPYRIVVFSPKCKNLH